MVINNHEFRIKKMNMIEVLALRSQITFKDVDSAMSLYNDILERIEVNINDKWFSVKAKNQDIFYPSGIENDVDVLQSLIAYFLQYIKSVFQKSDESKKQQESMSSENVKN